MIALVLNPQVATVFKPVRYVSEVFKDTLAKGTLNTNNEWLLHAPKKGQVEVMM